MSDTLSTPDPAVQVAEVREIIANRGTTPCEAVMLRVWRVVLPPPSEPPARPDVRPLAVDDNGWPYLNAEGTAWERHDDPHPEL